MAPPNEKPNTLHSAFIRGSTFRDGKFLSVTHGPTKDQGSLKNAGAVLHACDARGLASETSISDRFLLTLPFCFCVDAEKPARTLRHLCFHPPLLLLLFLPPVFVAFVRKRKKKDSKSEISTINFQSTLLSFSSSLLFF